MFGKISPSIRMALAISCFVLGMSLTASAAEVGKTAPDFTLKSLSGENMKLSEMTGKSC